jgi:hypothetical protein
VPTIALHADDQRLIGFILIAGTDSLTDGPVVRDCVILATPTDAVMLDQPLLAAIEPWLNDERYAHVVAHGNRIVVHVTLGVEDKLILDVDPLGSGRWRLDPDASAVGWCRLAALGEP